MFFGLSPLELVVLAALALTLFGPDKLPGAVREGARIFGHIRSAAHGARAEVLEQLGPELLELDPRRLDPRTVAREQLREVFDPLRSAREDVRRQVREVRDAARLDDHSDRLAALEAQPSAPAGAAQDAEIVAGSAAAPGANRDSGGDSGSDRAGPVDRVRSVG